jgi:hypothetical protein
MELSRDTDQPQIVSEGTGSEPIEELAFTETIYDGSDLPIDIVAQHLVTGSCQGFDVEEDGSLCRSAAVEDTEFDEDYGDEVGSMIIDAPVLGRGHRKKHETRPFGGLEAWEEH